MNNASGNSVTDRADARRGDEFYNDFYRDGGWKYSTWREYIWHRRRVVKPFGLRRGMKLLEVACGNGFHTNLFRRMGLHCVGIDRSTQGIAWAKSNYPKCTYHCADIMNELPVKRASFDVVMARGCSHYHYDMQGEQPFATTRRILEYLRPGGVFIMIVLTDLSGKRTAGNVWHNTLDDYDAHFSSFGYRYCINWAKGVVVCGLYNDHSDYLVAHRSMQRSEVLPQMLSTEQPQSA